MTFSYKVLIEPLKVSIYKQIAKGSFGH